MSGFGVVVLIWLLVMFGSVAVSVAMYVCGSLGSYTIAKRRGINHPWLAWIPVANVWTLGCISDQYQQVVCGKLTGRRKILLTLNIIAAVVGVVFFAIYFYVCASLIFGVLQNSGGSQVEMELYLENLLTSQALPVVLVFGVATLVLSVVGIVAAIYAYIALYDLYRSANPNNAVLFLVLSILFNFTQPFFIFACRNKDLGMHPQTSTYFPPQS